MLSKIKYHLSNLFYEIAIVVCILLLIASFFRHATVQGVSMEKTLHDKDNLIVSSLSYKLHKINRYDVAIINCNKSNSFEYIVKRVIGMPGDTVQIIDKKVYINNKELTEDIYGKEPIDDAGNAENPIKLKENEYFCLGDNRNNSLDSRFKEIGVIKKSQFIGKVLLFSHQDSFNFSKIK